MGSRVVGFSHAAGCSESPAPSVLVNSAWGSEVMLGFWFRFGAWKALTPSVLVKRVTLLRSLSPGIRSAVGGPVLGWEWIRQAGSGFWIGGCWGGSTGSAKRFSQIFSGSCNAPLPPFCDPGARPTLNGWGCSVLS
jgi:hypothetical protein